MNTIFRIWVVIILYVFAPEKLMAQDIEESGQILKTFDTDFVTTVGFLNKEGDVLVKTWDNDIVEVIIDYKIKGDNKEDINTLIEALEDMEVSTNKSELKINTRFYASMLQIQWLASSKVKIKLPGTGTITLKEFEVNYTLTIPADKHLNLKNHYGDVNLNTINKNVSLDLYDCDLKAEDFGGDLELKLRYSDAIIGSAGNTNLNTYDSDLEIENTGDLDLISKYSKIDIEKCGNVDIDLYDDKVYIDELLALSGTAKYTSLFVGDITNSKLEIYDAVLEAGRINNLDLISKYSKISALSVGSEFEFDLYDDKVNIGSVNSIAGNSKYTSFIFNNMEKGMKYYASYDDDITIRNIESNFDMLDIESKYTSVDLTFESGAEYQLHLDLKYADYDIKGRKMIEQSHSKDGNQFNIIFHTKNASDNPDKKVLIDMYDGKVSILNN